MSEPLFDDRHRRRARRLDRSLSALGDLAPRLGVPEEKWHYPAESSPNGHHEANNSPPDGATVNGRPVGPSVPARCDPLPARSVPADPATALTAEQKEELIKHIGIGMGRYGACAQVNVPVRALCQEMHEDLEFGDRVRDTENRCVNDCMMVIYEAALKGSVPAAIGYVKFALAKEATAEVLRQGRDHLRNEEKYVNNISSESGTLGLAYLTLPETARYHSLRKLVLANTITASDLVIWTALLSKMNTGMDQPALEDLNREWEEGGRQPLHLDVPVRTPEELARLFLGADS